MAHQRDQLLERLAERNPVPVSDIDSLQVGQMERVRAQVMAAIHDSDSTSAGGSGFWQRSRLLALVPACLLLAGAVTLGLGGLNLGSGGEPGYAQAAVRVAETAPRLLVRAPGWRIINVSSFGPDQGELIFGDSSKELDYDGHNELQISWYPAEAYDERIHGWDKGSEFDPQIEVLGQPAQMFGGQIGRDRPDSADGASEPPIHFITFTTPENGTYAEIRGTFHSEAEYRQLLDSLEPVDVNTWLAAMPASVIALADRPAAVDEMLSDVPVPASVSIDQLRSGPIVTDWTELATQVVNTVSCGWIDQWAQAERGGDAGLAAKAETALASEASWPVVEELADRSPGLTRNVNYFAGQVVDGSLELGFGPFPSGLVLKFHGSWYEFGPPYAVSLGCDSVLRRPVGSSEAPTTVPFRPPQMWRP